ncbi:DUF1343 domain-containing protein [uncultured Treponema sp.]|uniref:exo-beta-N-acetylmuramidase NamZ family protein n=1 Tax=uncultured Treponema sp. TaxID=162155 RepID=UPI0025E60164|nr:DUF1343 domain-containing protein [uncultured Treponema sp.]
MIKKTAYFLLLMICFAGVLIFTVCTLSKSAGYGLKSRVILGDEQFEQYEPLLKDKRVALFSNHSGIVGDKITLSDGRIQYGGFVSSAENDFSLIPFGKDLSGKSVSYGDHVLDLLISHGINVTTIFCPEHGFRGTEDAGTIIANSVDEKTGVPIRSLYEDDMNHTINPKNMEFFDTLVIDIQDVGLRYYTYYITLYYLIDECAKNQKQVIILDRPNPNGFYVDGEILRDECKSGVGLLPLPTVHGMTLGELALMINGEGWLSADKNACDLTVIPCKNYTHQTKYALVRAPSPNIKDMRSVYLYASTCFFENTIVSIGRGTDFPFEVYGSPCFFALSGADFSFEPKSMPGAVNPPFLGEKCYGIDLRSKPIEEIFAAGCDISYLLDAYHKAKIVGKKTKFWGSLRLKNYYWIDLLSGSSKLREQVESGLSAEEIKKGWQSDITSFRNLRKPYLLYEE